MHILSILSAQLEILDPLLIPTEIYILQVMSDGTLMLILVGCLYYIHVLANVTILYLNN